MAVLLVPRLKAQEKFCLGLVSSPSLLMLPNRTKCVLLDIRQSSGLQRTSPSLQVGDFSQRAAVMRKFCAVKRNDIAGSGLYRLHTISEMGVPTIQGIL